MKNNKITPPTRDSLITKIPLPIRFTGLLYEADDIDISDNINFITELKKAKSEDDAPWVLKCCSITKDKKLHGEKLKFDLNVKDSYECYFIGFLYDDGKVLGKIKYIRDANSPDEVINGRYSRIKKNKIILCGIWDDNSRKMNFVIELIVLK